MQEQEKELNDQSQPGSDTERAAGTDTAGENATEETAEETTEETTEEAAEEEAD